MILLFGIFVLIVIDYVQLEVPKYLGQTIDMLSESEVLSELDTIGESDEYKLVFTYDSEAETVFWQKDYFDPELDISRRYILVDSDVLPAILEIEEDALVDIDNGLLYWENPADNSVNEIITVVDLMAILDNSYRVRLNDIVLMVVVIILIVGAGRVLWRLAIFGTSRKIEYGLRNDMFSHATKLGQDYYSHQKVGGLMTYFINDLSAVRMALGPGLMMLVDSLFLGGFAITRMYNLNKEITYIILIPILALIVGMIIINRSMRNQFRVRQEKFRDLSDFTQESFSGLSVIKAYVREAYEIATFKKRSNELYDTNIKFFKRSLWVQMITSIAINLVIVVIIGVGSYAVVRTVNMAQDQRFTVGALTEYIALFGTLTWPTMALARFLSLFSRAQASAQRIEEFLDTKPTVYDSEDLIVVDELKPAIKVENLSFSYPDEPEEIVLDNISFEIKAGEMVGILGKTGAGKTTLVDLLLRVYNVEENKIFLDKYDIMKLPLKQVRNTIGYVPQDNFLFSDTIKKNIAFSRDNMKDDEIIDSAKFADIYENVIEFKEGFQTVLGERGVTVSGGQKQRISIARALAKNPDILILDDSVSAVDTKTEETIINNLYKLRRGKTTILIAHRISTVKDLDKIIILDEGKIIDIGSHKELLERSPFYQDIVRRQTLEEKVKGDDFNA